LIYARPEKGKNHPRVVKFYNKTRAGKGGGKRNMAKEIVSYSKKKNVKCATQDVSFHHGLADLPLYQETGKK